jgi:hypothetical protein
MTMRRREHGTDEGNHQVEGSVLVGQGFGIALIESNLGALGFGTRPGLLDETRGDVDAGHPGAGCCRRKGHLPGAAGHVQHPGSRLDGYAGQKFQRAGLEILRHHAVVTGTPGSLLFGLYCFQFRC